MANHARVGTQRWREDDLNPSQTAAWRWGASAPVRNAFFAGFKASAAVPVSRGSTPGPASDGRHLRGVRYGSSLGKLATAATGQVATFEYSGY